MHPATPGITFRCGMTGWFNLGSIDPHEGYAQGRAARTRLTISLTVTIADVRVFMRDREQPGHLDATIDLLPLGRDLRSVGGAFNLTPAISGGCAVSTIECTFNALGTTYYLAARTETQVVLPGANGREPTRLPVRLHEGADAHAPVIGAGVLALTSDDIARLVSTMRVTGAESLGDSTLTLTGFGRYFLGSEWDTYARPPGSLRGHWQALGRRARRLVRR